MGAAQKAVAAQERALADAQSSSQEADAALCDAATTYVSALDRYGDVLHQTAPTVGDVRDAGADLAEPADQTRDAADAAVDARDAVTSAEEDLAQAQADLATAEAVAAGTTAPAPPSPTPNATRSQPSPGVARVQEAEDEFEATRSGISDRTPLAQAAESFNAAVVALEGAWIQLLAPSGCLSEDQQKEAAAAADDYSAALQESLSDAGYYEGEVDGVYGPATVAAVEKLQKEHGLPVTGTMDKASSAALGEDLANQDGASAADDLASTAAVQQTLKLAGYWDGPVDGAWSDELTQAIETAQGDLGVKVTGTVDAATVEAFEEALTSAQESAQATEEPAPTPSSSAEGDDS